MDDNIFEVRISRTSLEQCSSECNTHLPLDNIKVEVGGVLIGTFDGLVMIVKRLLFDEKAKCNPASIYISPDIFKIAEKEVEKLNKDTSLERWFILGTWHTHPEGIDTYSSTDETMLFRDRMRIITDDPSLSLAPWIHFIFPSYIINPIQFRVFTMHLKSNYELDAFNGSDKLNGQLIGEFSSDTNMGLLVSKRNDIELSISHYHPNIFEMHREGLIVIKGLWKYYPYERITSIFEKIFLENFFQKVRLENFIYIRLLNNQKMKPPIVEWFKCKSFGTHHDISKVVEFKEVKIYIDDLGNEDAS